MFNLIRWMHILSAAAWFGEVCIMTFVLVPYVTRLSTGRRAEVIRNLFPRLFHFASYAIIINLISGLWLNYLITGWQDLPVYFQSRHGMLILISGILGLAIAVIHFFVSNKIELAMAQTGYDADLQERLLRYLGRIPRIGLVLLTASLVLMMAAARGL